MAKIAVEPVVHEKLAAVDLGSNSFHLQIARVVDGQIYLLDSLREPVRLGAGLTRDRRIDRATQARALEALERFGERLRGFPPAAVRVVGTNALRVARNADQFLEAARQALGFRVEVIFGREEARLIHLGVSHSLPVSPEKRLVVDIGGGSTEFIIGTAYVPELMESLSMGSVSWSRQFFVDGLIDKASFKRAELAAANELQRIVKAYRRAGWAEVVGSSGTAKSIAAILSANGWSPAGIDIAGLERLRSHLLRAGDVASLKIPGLREDRQAILPGGVAIMSAIFGSLGIEQMSIAEGALRQGVLYDLLGRISHHDMREATVREFVRRYHVDVAQAERVGALADRIYVGLLPDPQEQDRLLLQFSASLHEIGVGIAHAGYHKHSAYILSQADMPGFSRDEQARLAHVVLAHRGRLSKLEDLAVNRDDWPLILSLRIAALLCLSRGDITVPRFACRSGQDSFEFSLPRDWLEDHPLSEASLSNETEEWRGLGVRFVVRAVDDARIKDMT